MAHNPILCCLRSCVARGQAGVGSFSPGVFLVRSDWRGRESVYGWPVVTRETQPKVNSRSSVRAESCSVYPQHGGLWKGSLELIEESLFISIAPCREKSTLPTALDEDWVAAYFNIIWGRSEGEVLCCMSWSYWFLRAGRWIVFVCTIAVLIAFYLRNNERSVDSWTYGTNQQQFGPIYSHCTALKQYVFIISYCPHTCLQRFSHTLKSHFL